MSRLDLFRMLAADKHASLTEIDYLVEELSEVCTSL
jgi:hypothetical protein